MKIIRRLILGSLITSTAIGVGSFFNSTPQSVAQVEVSDEVLISRLADDICVGLKNGVTPYEIGRTSAMTMPQHRAQLERIYKSDATVNAVMEDAYLKCPSVIEAHVAAQQS